MKRMLLVGILLLSPVSLAQDKPTPLLSNSQIQWMTSLGFSASSLICKAAGPDPEDLYDCKLDPGSSLDGVMRIMLRQQRDEWNSCERDKKALEEGWQRSIDEIQKALRPKPIPKDKGGRS